MNGSGEVPPLWKSLFENFLTFSFQNTKINCFRSFDPYNKDSLYLCFFYIKFKCFSEGTV